MTPTVVAGHVIPDPSDVPIRVRVPVQVTHYCSPAKLFLRYDFDGSDANVASQASALSKKHLYDAYIGMFCIVRRDPGRFLRAQVTDVHRNINGIQVSVDVLYVDTGETDLLGLDCVFSIDDALAAKPNMTAPCCIRKLRPTSLSSALDLDRVIPCSGAFFEAIFYSVSEAGVYEVDLFIRNTEERAGPTRQNVSELLVQHGFAQFLGYLNGNTQQVIPCENGSSEGIRTAEIAPSVPVVKPAESVYVPSVPPRLPSRRDAVIALGSVDTRITFILTPDHFYGQLLRLEKELLQLQADIKSGTMKQCHESEIVRGGYYIYKDLPQQSSVRVRAEEILMGPTSRTQVRVFLVDYGNRKTVDSLCLYKMNVKLSQIGPLALRFQLADVQPWSEWTETSVIHFENLTRSDECLEAFVLDTKSSGDEFEDTVYVVRLAGKTVGNIADSLIRNGYVTTPPQGGKNDARQEYNPMEEDFHNPLNSYKVNTDDVGVVTANFAYNGEHRICKFFTKRGYCREGQLCSYEHVRGDSNSLMLFAEEKVARCPKELWLPRRGSRVLAEMSALVNPSHFYLIFPYGTKPVNELFWKESSLLRQEETLKELMEEMQVVYRRATFKENRLLHKSMGELVAARSKQDNRWYRARLVGVSSEKDVFEVYFVDFGDTEWVAPVCLMTLEERFLHLPFQAFQACLVDVEPKGCDHGNTWSAEASAAFGEYASDKCLLVEIVDRSVDLLCVKLFYFDANRLHSVSDRLEGSWHAQCTTECHQSSAAQMNALPWPA